MVNDIFRIILFLFSYSFCFSQGGVSFEDYINTIGDTCNCNAIEIKLLDGGKKREVLKERKIYKDRKILLSASYEQHCLQVTEYKYDSVGDLIYEKTCSCSGVLISQTRYTLNNHKLTSALKVYGSHIVDCLFSYDSLGRITTQSTYLDNNLSHVNLYSYPIGLPLNSTCITLNSKADTVVLNFVVVDTLTNIKSTFSTNGIGDTLALKYYYLDGRGKVFKENTYITPYPHEDIHKSICYKFVRGDIPAFDAYKASSKENYDCDSVIVYDYMPNRVDWDVRICSDY